MNEPHLTTADGQIVTVGSRWQHSNWAPGTPDAIVGELLLESNYFRWLPGHNGGLGVPTDVPGGLVGWGGGMPRKMHRGNGWSRVDKPL